MKWPIAPGASGPCCQARPIVGVPFVSGVRALGGTSAVSAGCSPSLDGESELAEHGDGARLPTLEVAGREALPCGELVGRAEDRLWRVPVFLPNKVVGRGWGETVSSEEGLRPE